MAALFAVARNDAQAGNTLKPRSAAIRFLHQAARLPSSTDPVEVSNNCR